jgi:hypothetical protein
MIIVGADLCVCPNVVGVQQLAAACINKLMHSENRIVSYFNLQRQTEALECKELYLLLP